jgi:metal-responsive CopG/Arc/MetJ family transcriptional regulator
MRQTLTISLPKALRTELSRIAKRKGITRSEFVRKAIQDQIWDEAFQTTRRMLVPRARAMGIYTDEDVFKLIS